MSSRTVFVNCGRIVTGELAAPTAEADTIIVEDQTIEFVGFRSQADINLDDLIVDVCGNWVIPGLVDAHSHPVIGDYTPRQETSGWTQKAVDGGVTTLISAGEVHWPNRTKDGDEATAVAAAAYLTSRKRQPRASRVMGGALMLDRGVSTTHIDALDNVGVDKLGEIGLGSEKDINAIIELVDHAKKKGWVAPLHFGGASVPGSSVVDADYAFEVKPTVISHINGGPTARSIEEALSLVLESDFNIEVVFAGNQEVARSVIAELERTGELSRLQFGTDTPSGTGVAPIAMLRLITECASWTHVPVEQLICCASGETFKKYNRAGQGLVRAGSPADLVVLSQPQGGSRPSVFDSMHAGNVPSVALAMIDGHIERIGSKVTPPPEIEVIIDSTRNIVGS